MRLLLLLLIILTVTLVSGTNFVDNRSGHIVIKPSEDKESQLFLKGSVFDKASLSNVNDVQVSNIITHVMGLLPLNEDKDRSGFPRVSVFNKPKLNLFFSVEDVSKDDLINSKVLNSESMISIKKTFTPQDSISELTTIVSGVTPDVHGIPSSSWINNSNGNKVRAYEKSTQSSAANIAYLANTSFNGKSMIISSSADKQFASATGVHTGISSLYKNSDVYTYSVRPTGAIEAVVGSNRFDGFSLTNNQIETIIYSKEFQQFVLPKGFKASFSKGIFTIVDNKDAITEIDFDHHESGALLSELVSVFNIVKNIKSNEHLSELAKDSVPDFISFDFSAISFIRKSYGSNSVEFKTVLAIVEQTIENTIASLSGVYGDRVACEIVALAPSHVFTQDQIDSIENVIGEDVHDITKTLPHVFLKSTSNAQDVCSQIKSTLEKSNDLSAECFVHSFVPSFINANAAGSGSGSGSSSSNSSNALLASENTNRIALFNVFVFFPIVFLGFVLAGIMYIAKISFDAQSDTLLYRSSQRQY